MKFVRASFAKFPMGIKNVSFNGPIQIELKDLTKKVPFVSAAVFYFIDPPDVDFQMTKGAVMELKIKNIEISVKMPIVSGRYYRHVSRQESATPNPDVKPSSNIVEVGENDAVD